MHKQLFRFRRHYAIKKTASGSDKYVLRYGICGDILVINKKMGEKMVSVMRVLIRRQLWWRFEKISPQAVSCVSPDFGFDFRPPLPKFNQPPYPFP